VKNLIYIFILLYLASCTTLGYDPHTRPVPEQAGQLLSVNINFKPPKNSVVLPLYSVEKPFNHESGWDSDDLVLVFKSPLIDSETSIGRWSWGSGSLWTKFRLRPRALIGYGGKFSGRILPGEIRLYCGTRGQFLVYSKTIFLIYE